MPLEPAIAVFIIYPKSAYRTLRVYYSAKSTIMQIYMNTFSKILKEEKLEKGYSQRYMAEKLQIPQSTYKGYELVGEKNGREPLIDMIRKICRLLEISADYLLGLEAL